LDAQTLPIRNECSHARSGEFDFCFGPAKR